MERIFATLITLAHALALLTEHGGAVAASYFKAHVTDVPVSSSTRVMHIPRALVLAITHLQTRARELLENKEYVAFHAKLLDSIPPEDRDDLPPAEAAAEDAEGGDLAEEGEGASKIIPSSTHPKLVHLEIVISEHFAAHPDSRVIVFSQVFGFLSVLLIGIVQGKCVCDCEETERQSFDQGRHCFANRGFLLFSRSLLLGKPQAQLARVSVRKRFGSFVATLTSIAN
jgi:hypothetical protein